MTDANSPLMPVDDIAAGLGLTLPVDARILPALTLAAAGVSRLIRDYTGRMLTLARYTDVFHDHGSRYGLEPTLTLSERPVQAVVSANMGTTAVTVRRLHRDLGRITVHGHWPHRAELEVTYDAGYSPIPADLQLVVLDLVRRQLGAMGVDLTAAGGGAVAGAAPVKSVSVGSLRVDYAVAGASASDMVSSSASPLTAATLDLYAPVLDLYRSARSVAGTDA